MGVSKQLQKRSHVLGTSVDLFRLIHLLENYQLLKHCTEVYTTIGQDLKTLEHDHRDSDDRVHKVQ